MSKMKIAFALLAVLVVLTAPAYADVDSAWRTDIQAGAGGSLPAAAQ